MLFEYSPPVLSSKEEKRKSGQNSLLSKNISTPVLRNSLLSNYFSPMEENGDLKKNLTHFLIRDAIDKDQELITVSSNCTIERTLEVLEKNNISCVPVVNSEYKTYRLVDMLDIVSFVMVVDENDIPLSQTDFLTLLAKEKHFKTPVSKVADLSSRNPFHPISHSAPLLQAVELFSCGFHRVPIYEGKNFFNLFTQSQFLRFLADNLYLLSDFGDKSCIELQLGTLSSKRDQIIQISPSEPAIEAFRMIRKYNLSAVAVVNEEGYFIGQVSASDLKGLAIGGLDSDYTLRSLLVPLSQYLPNLRKSQNKEPDYMVWVSSTLSLNNLILYMNKHEMHRVYVLENTSEKEKGKRLVPCSKLLGVISITDVAKMIMQYYQY